ncbi:hypothetical protein DFH28DRAFT_856713, partial [Melampsora americana]
MPTLSVDQLIAKVLSLSQTSPLGSSAPGNKIFESFSCFPIVSLETDEDGMWAEVNLKMDAAYGSDVSPEQFKENSKGGKYGLECVLLYLNKAREHPTWTSDHDSLLSIKLE